MRFHGLHSAFAAFPEKIGWRIHVENHFEGSGVRVAPGFRSSRPSLFPRLEDRQPLDSSPPESVPTGLWIRSSGFGFRDGPFSGQGHPHHQSIPPASRAISSGVSECPPFLPPFQQPVIPLAVPEGADSNRPACVPVPSIDSKLEVALSADCFAAGPGVRFHNCPHSRSFPADPTDSVNGYHRHPHPHLAVVLPSLRDPSDEANPDKPTGPAPWLALI